MSNGMECIPPLVIANDESKCGMDRLASFNMPIYFKIIYLPLDSSSVFERIVPICLVTLLFTGF
jgi:hypothetical protein